MLSPIARIAAPISDSEYADLMEESETLGTLDIGTVLLTRCMHPTRGDIILVSNFRGPYGVIEQKDS